MWLLYSIMFDEIVQTNSPHRISYSGHIRNAENVHKTLNRVVTRPCAESSFNGEEWHGLDSSQEDDSSAPEWSQFCTIFFSLDFGSNRGHADRDSSCCAERTWILVFWSDNLVSFGCRWALAWCPVPLETWQRSGGEYRRQELQFWRQLLNWSDYCSCSTKQFPDR